MKRSTSGFFIQLDGPQGHWHSPKVAHRSPTPRVSVGILHT